MAANKKKPPVPLVTPTPAAVATGTAVPVSAPPRPPDRTASVTIPPPPAPPPATVNAGGPSTNAALNALLKHYPGYKLYINTILQAWKDFKIDPVVLLATLIWENEAGDPKIINKSSGAAGLAQILDKSANAKNAAGVPFFRGNLNISLQDKLDPTFAIKYMAWRMSGYLRSGQSLQQAYQQGYHGGGYTGDSRGTDPGALINKYAPHYLPETFTSPGGKATEDVGTQAATAAVKQQIYDMWVVTKPNGTVGFVKITDPTKPPKNVVMGGQVVGGAAGAITSSVLATRGGEQAKKIAPAYIGGVPLTLSQFQATKEKLDAYFYQFLNRQATNQEVVQLTMHPQSSYQLSVTLSKKPGFTKSPIYKAHANGVVGVARAYFGEQWQPSTPAAKNLIRRAIVENWDDATLKTNLMNMPEYLKGPMYQDTVSKFTNVYQTIYGIPGQNSQQIIKEAAAKGWSADEFASWLRAQPAYTSSAEYQTKALDIATQLGLITGQMPSLAPGTLPKNPNPASPLNPDSPRIPLTPKPIAPTTVGGNTLIVQPVKA